MTSEMITTDSVNHHLLPVVTKIQKQSMGYTLPNNLSKAVVLNQGQFCP